MIPLTFHISGTVWLDNPGGIEAEANGIIDENERGIPNVEVILYKKGDPDYVAKTLTNEEGYYIFEYVRVGFDYYVEFAYDGQLPGKADITIFVGTDKFGEGQKDLNLYYYNDSTSEYEEMGTVKYNNGNVILSLDHCSTYVLTEEKLGITETPEVPGENEETTTPTTETDNEKDETPKTGVSNIYVIVASLLIVVSTGIIVFVKRMK